MPVNIPISPMRLTTKAFFAASLADFFSNQWPIRRYELNPTSSHDTYIMKKLFVTTMPSIENVNTPRYAKYRPYRTSPCI